MSEAAINHTTSLVCVPGPGGTSTFFFDGHPVRVALKGDKPWIAAVDICAALSLRDVSDAVAKLDADEKGRASIPTPGGMQDMLVVDESGMLTIILRCRGATTPGTLPHRFRRWVTGEVLPAIRKTGTYSMPGTSPAPSSGVALLEALRDPHAVLALVAHHAQERIVAEQRAEVAEATVEEQRPMVDAYLAFLDDDGLCCLSTAARAIDAPERLFFAWLRDRGFAFDRDGFLQPRADLRKDGYLKVKIGPSNYGRRRPQTMVTHAGLAWLRHRWIVGPGRTLALQAAVAAKQGSLPGLDAVQVKRS